MGDITSFETWIEVPLGDLLTRITYGFTNPMPTTLDGPFMVTAKDIRGGRIDYSSARRTSNEAYLDDLTDKSRPRIGDILLTKDGSIGRVAVCDRSDICINQSVALLQPREGVDSRFLACLLQAPYYQTAMAADADGSTIKHIYISRVDKMKVRVPNAVGQRAIAEVLGALDDKIAANERVIRTLDELSDALVQRASTGLDPVFVRDVLTLNYGKALPTSTRVDGEVPVYGSGGQVGTHEVALVDSPGIIMGRKGTVGALYWSDVPFFPIDTTYYVSPKDEYSPEVVFYALRRIKFGDLNSDSAVPGLNRGEAYAQQVRLPSRDVAPDLVGELSAIFASVSAIRRENGAVADTRDELLPLLMSGKVTVVDAEKLVADAV